MILYVNGDSHSCGDDLTDPEGAWPNVLAKKLNYDLINHAQTGGSNPSVLRTTENFLDQNHSSDQLFVIIGWTGWEREEWEHQGCYYNVNASGRNIVPKDLADRYKKWVIDQNDESRSKKSKILHQAIFKLHQNLTNKKIPHLFFNALMPFQHEALHNVDCQFDWGDNYLKPYNNDYAYYWFLKNQGYASNKLYHHNESAQHCWAEFLYSYIQQHQII